MGRICRNSRTCPRNGTRPRNTASLFPNVLLGIHRDHFYAIRLEPVSLNQTREHLEIYYVGDAAADPQSSTNSGEDGQPRATWATVFSEDVGVVERMQSGRSFAGL